MESMNELAISQYMVIGDKIVQLQKRKSYKYWAFYQQSFCTSVAYTGYEIISQSIKADTALERLEETLQAIDHHIEILKMKQGFWNKFLSSLQPKERQYFQDKYIKGHICLNEKLDQQAAAEINEINEAIDMRFCTNEYKKPIEIIENDFMGNLDRMLEAMGV